MSPQLQKALEIATSIEEVISVRAIEPPQNILDQIENKDSVYLDFVIQTKSGEMPFAIVVPKTLVDDVDDSLNIPIKELLSCGCTQVEDGVGHMCGYSIYDNFGKMTYYVRESDQYLVKLIDTKAPAPSVETENLKKLVEKLKAVDGVNRIVIEEVVDEKLKQEFNSEKPIIVKAYIDTNNDKIIDHFISFGLSELVYDIETSHEWAVNNLMDMIEKNNAQ